MEQITADEKWQDGNKMRNNWIKSPGNFKYVFCKLHRNDVLQS